MATTTEQEAAPDRQIEFPIGTPVQQIEFPSSVEQRSGEGSMHVTPGCIKTVTSQELDHIVRLGISIRLLPERKRKNNPSAPSSFTRNDLVYEEAVSDSTDG